MSPVDSAAPRAGGAWPQLSAHHDFSEFHGARKLPAVGAGEIAKTLGLAHAGSALRLSASAAQNALQRTGLASLADAVAATLSHGAKRQLEIAMCLATAPQILLLDEPLAGMDSEETERMLELLNELKVSHAILLVEHDMDAVFRVRTASP